MKISTFGKIGLTLLAPALAFGIASCAPATSPATLTPPGQGQLQFPGQGYTGDFSQVPSQYSTIINQLMGGYTVSVQIEPAYTNNWNRTVRTAQLTLTRNQNNTNSGFRSWGSIEIVLLATGNLPEVRSTTYLGVNPQPVYGRYFQFATPSFSMPELSDSPIALQLYLAVNQQGQFDGPNSGIITKDCSVSNTSTCLNTSQDLVFGNDLRRR
ncbi:MAG: hypothetical protein JNL01_00910 [Bdellovibrionales bacterium]|nr:hypothetical protein [Bdellovibrionales bacterium]